MGAILMTSAKLTTLGVLKRKILLNKIDDVLISVYDVTSSFITWLKLYCRYGQVTKVS